jgi:Mg2+/Co2+ transporter CorC
LFPNPAMESATIRSIPVGTITIIDALGKIVFHTEDNKDETMQLDVSKWEIGVYSVRVDGSEIQKFAKQ